MKVCWSQFFFSSLKIISSKCLMGEDILIYFMMDFSRNRELVTFLSWIYLLTSFVVNRSAGKSLLKTKLNKQQNKAIAFVQYSLDFRSSCPFFIDSSLLDWHIWEVNPGNTCSPFPLQTHYLQWFQRWKHSAHFILSQADVEKHWRGRDQIPFSL